MKARNRVRKIRLSADEYDLLNQIHQRYGEGVRLSTFCREILVNVRIHLYNYTNADLLNKPLGIEDKVPLENRMEKRYHAKCRLLACLLLLLNERNVLNDSMGENLKQYTDTLSYLRGYSFNSETKKKEYTDKVTVLPKGTKRAESLTLRLNREEDSRVMSSYGSSPHFHIMSFQQWARQTLLGKIKQSDFQIDFLALFIRLARNENRIAICQAYYMNPTGP